MKKTPLTRSSSSQSSVSSSGTSEEQQRSRSNSIESYYRISPTIMLTQQEPTTPTTALLSSSLSSNTSTIRPGPKNGSLDAYCELERMSSEDASNAENQNPNLIIDIPPSQQRLNAYTIDLAPGSHLRRTVSSASSNSPPDPAIGLHLGGPTSFAERRPRLYASLKALALFVISLATLYVMINTLLPPIDRRDRDKIKLPRSFEDLKALNEVLQVYKDRNYWRVLGCFTTVYLFLQAFSIPGSMYMSILAGAMYGVLIALPLVCFCGATGALLCYLLSATLGPAVLLSSPKWTHRLDRWKEKINAQGDNLISYLIVLRISPLPPHWMVNMMAPHLGINIPIFWISTFFGITGISYIHTTIGTTLHQMTSSKDFHLISWTNFLGLTGIVIAVLIPVILRRVWAKEIAPPSDDDDGSDAVAEYADSTPSPADSVLISTRPAATPRPSHDSPLVSGARYRDSVSDPSEESEEDDEEEGENNCRGSMTKVSKVLGVKVTRKSLAGSQK